MDHHLILKQLKLFFPHNSFTPDNLDQYAESDELVIQEDSIANTLKGALLDESIVEVQLHDLDKVFFCRILDNPFGNSDSDPHQPTLSVDSRYESGAYLDNHDHMIITPLEPSIGNYLILAYSDPKVPLLLRIISAGIAIELVCFYEHRTHLGDMPVLRLTFPLVAKKKTGVREFRVKVPKKMDFQVKVERLKKSPISTEPLNISLKGMSLIDPMGRRSNLKVGEKILCELQIPENDPILVDSSIIHVTNLRDSKGVQHCFGVKFNLSRPDIKASIEKLVAYVQRKHLRELSNIEENFGVIFDK